MPVAYLDATIEAFRKLGRDADAMAMTYMRELFLMGETEMLMTLRAQWLGQR